MDDLSKPVKRIKQRKPMKRTGFQSKPTHKRLVRNPTEWDILRPAIKKAFEQAGIISCEAYYNHCWRDNALSFGHAVKRRYLIHYAPFGSPFHIATVILICTPCHAQIELLKPELMRDEVMRIINNRTGLENTIIREPLSKLF